MRFFTSNGCSRTSKRRHCGGARSRRHKARQHAHRRGFAGAVGAEKTDDLSFLHLEGNVVNSSMPGIPLRQIGNSNHKNLVLKIRRTTLAIAPLSQRYLADSYCLKNLMSLYPMNSGRRVSMGVE